MIKPISVTPTPRFRHFLLKTRKLNRFEKPEDEEIMFWAYFDFQSDSHIFSDVLTKKDYQLFPTFP